jgi:hypothetical protein
MDVGVSRPDVKTSLPRRTAARRFTISRQLLGVSRSAWPGGRWLCLFGAPERDGPVVSTMRKRRAFDPTSMAAKRDILSESSGVPPAPLASFEMDAHHEDPRRTSRARNLVASGAMVSAVGIGLAGSASQDVGGVILAFGWVVLVAGIHTFGRLGTPT